MFYMYSVCVIIYANKDYYYYYLAHTEIIFKELGILPIGNIFIVHISKWFTSSCDGRIIFEK